MIEVTDRAFDDFAGVSADRKALQQILGIDHS
jgi:hypothetical protein